MSSATPDLLLIQYNFFCWITWMLFPVWPRRTFSAIIRYLPSGPTRGRRGRFELWSPSWRIYGLAWKRKQP